MSGFPGIWAPTGKLYFEEREALQGGGYNRGALQEYDPADGSTATVWDAPPTCSLWVYQDTYTNVLPPGAAGPGLALAVRHRRRSGRQPLLFDERRHPRACAHHPADEKITPTTYPPSRLAQTADGRWLFWTESNDENAHVAYGLIAPNDFAAGSTDYTPVEMWAG